MPAAISDQAFPDCRDFMNKALEAKKGWRARFEERGSAVSFRMRCYTARRRELAFNIKLYPEGEMMHGKTVWDGLVFLLREAKGGWEVVASTNGAAGIMIWEGPVE